MDRANANERAVIESGVASSLRPLWPSVYVPNLIIATGQGAMIASLALAAHQEGASPAIAGIVVTLNGLGTMLFDIPAGLIVARIGEALSGWVAATLLVLGLIGAVTTRHSVVALSASVFVAACGWAVWNLVRLNHLSRVAAPELRGRALSIFGGVTRAGQVLGPFIVIAIYRSNARGSFVIYLVSAVVGFAWLVIARDRTDHGAAQGRLARIHPVAVLADNSREFATAGVGTFGISLLRGSRTVIIALWGLHIGLHTSQILFISGVSSLLDLSLFYPAGMASDSFGRKAVAMPCLVLLSLGHLIFPLTHAFSTLLAASLLLGFGNGLGSGIVMTLGADRAPDVGRSSFLAVWRLVSDTGTTAGPLVDSGVTAFASLAAAIPVVGIIGLASAFVVGLWMRDLRLVARTRAPNYKPKQTKPAVVTSAA